MLFPFCFSFLFESIVRSIIRYLVCVFFFFVFFLFQDISERSSCFFFLSLRTFGGSRIHGPFQGAFTPFLTDFRDYCDSVYFLRILPGRSFLKKDPTNYTSYIFSRKFNCASRYEIKILLIFTNTI